jgi:hypothetical protein
MHCRKVSAARPALPCCHRPCLKRALWEKLECILVQQAAYEKRKDGVYCPRTAPQQTALVPGPRSRRHHTSLSCHPAANRATVCHLSPESTGAADQRLDDRHQIPSAPTPHGIGQSALVFLIRRLSYESSCNGCISTRLTVSRVGELNRAVLVRRQKNTDAVPV